MEGPGGHRRSANRWTAVTLGLAAATLLVAATRFEPHPAARGALTGRTLAGRHGLSLCSSIRAGSTPTGCTARLWSRGASSSRYSCCCGRRVRGRGDPPVDPPSGSRPWPGATTCWPTRWRSASACSCTSRAGRSAGGADVPGPGHAPRPAARYLMSDPELSLQSMLMVAAIIGRAQAAATSQW